jgi:hypothetical protein
MELKGIQFGVRFVERGPKDKHVCIQLLSEDDETWFEVGNSFSSFWLDDLIQVLERAKALMASNPNQNHVFETDSGCGYRFKK